MKRRLTKIYTKTGDDGSTGLADGSRINKDTLRIEVIGCTDELNASIGVMIAHLQDPKLISLLSDIQNRLFDLGGELAIPGTQVIQPQKVTELEQTLDSLNKNLPALSEFILPGGSKAAAFTHLARTQCRRCERRLLALSRIENINTTSLHYLNRLSDLLFVMARYINKAADWPEPVWQR